MKLPAILLICLLSAATAAHAQSPAAKLRYPVSAVRLDARTLALANARSGSVSLVDTVERKVRSEITVGKRLSDLAVSSKGLLLLTDAQAHEVITCRLEQQQLVERQRVRVSNDPQSIVVSADGRRAFVVSRWSRRLDLLTIADDDRLAMEQSLELPFPARELAMLPDQQHLIVGDAFGGRLAVIDVKSQKVLSVRDVQGHNLASLVWDGEHDRLLVAHQLLNTLPLTLDNVQWGAAMKNVVRIISREQLLNPNANLVTDTRLISLGQEGDGSADPNAVLPLTDGSFVVALAGADELVIVESTGLVHSRQTLGRRPIALLAGGSERELLAVNQFDSSVIFVDLASETSEVLSLGPAPTLSAAERGERLFYDARLSFEKWMSCHSCHTDGHTNGQLADTLGDGSHGAAKRTLTLLGTRDTDRWAWNGEIKELHDQVRKSIETSMQGESNAQAVYDLTAYLHTLEPPPPLAPPRDEADRQQIEAGRQVFAQQRCTQCHIPPLTYTSHDVYEVWPSQGEPAAKFNPPSLRGVGQGSRFFHDGRATALEDVLDVYGHQVSDPLTDSDRAALLRFLRSL